MDPLSFLSNAEPGALDAMYARYLQDPESVDRSWRLFFAGFDLSRAQYAEDAASPATLKEFKVLDLIHGYRTRGHLFTQTNPVRARRTYLPTLDLAQFDLSEQLVMAMRSHERASSVALMMMLSSQPTMRQLAM